MPNLISRIIDPWYPATAIGLEKGMASVVHVEKARGGTCTVRRAASFDLAESILRPGFDERNIENPSQLASILGELATTAGLLRQKRWSLSLPEASTKTLLLTMETPPQSAAELQEVLTWKMERGFGAPLAELSISRERLEKDSQGRDRYLAIGTRRDVLAEYERLLESLGWRAGLILPRHIGESRWLVRNGSAGDSLLLSGSQDGFTAVILRDKHPLVVRTVNCHEPECEDELYRFLLFYRDRRSTEGDGRTGLARLMVVGKAFTAIRAQEIINETTGEHLRPLSANDVGLTLPGRELDFDVIAGPAGLATLSF